MKFMTLLSGAVLASSLLVQQASANIITGSIAQGGNVTLDSTSLFTATKATAFTSVSTGLGTVSYAGIPSGQAVTWTAPLLFAVGPEVITPLWTFTYSGVTYGFNLSAITGKNVATIGSADYLNLAGNGMLTATGYTPTYGTFSFSITDSSQGQGTAQFGFSASNTAIPDGGLTVALLGGALVALQVLRRKLVS